jgi:hypothetical protein
MIAFTLVYATYSWWEEQGMAGLGASIFREQRVPAVVGEIGDVREQLLGRAIDEARGAR